MTHRGLSIRMQVGCGSAGDDVLVRSESMGVVHVDGGLAVSSRGAVSVI